MHALTLNRLDDEGRDIAFGEFAGQGVEVAELDRGIGEERAEALAEFSGAVDRKRTCREPVVSMVEIDHARLSGGGTGELQRRFVGFRATVAEEHAIKPGRLGEQAFGKKPGEQRGVELHDVGEPGVE